MMVIETERLILRKLKIDDSAFIFELLNSPGWLKFIGDRNIKNINDAENYIISGPMVSYNLNGYGLWLVVLKTENEPIGLCGIIKREDLPGPDIGYALLEKHYKKGLATEAAKAVVVYAFEVLKFENLYGILNPQNSNSIQVLENCGLKFIEDIFYQCKITALYIL
jgi:[ribosomal protein S5]-alanine N-acetyltransferase